MRAAVVMQWAAVLGVAAFCGQAQAEITIVKANGQPVLKALPSRFTTPTPAAGHYAARALRAGAGHGV